MINHSMMYPNYLKTAKLFSTLLASEIDEVDVFSQLVEVFSNELTPNMSERWLSDWETLLGLPVLDAASTEIRQSNILSILRSSGTLTSDRIKEISISYENGEVEVVEDTAAHKFIVKFIGKKGVPPNYKAFTLAMEKVKPAHLEIGYQFSYNTRDYLSNFKREDLSKLIINDIREKNITTLLENYKEVMI